MNSTLSKRCSKCGFKNIYPIETNFDWRNIFCQKCGSYVGRLDNTLPESLKDKSGD